MNSSVAEVKSNGTQPAEVPPRRILAQLLVGNQIQQAVYVAARLGIADLLKDGPRPVADLAAAAGAHPESLYRLLRALAGFGVFAEDDQGCFALTPVASLLEAGTASCAFALWSGGVSYQVFGGLEYSVRTGEPSFEQLFGTDFFDYLSQNPQVGELFDELMSWHTGPVAPDVAACDFSGVTTVVDVGGGRGELLAHILRTHPSLNGILIDRPRLMVPAKAIFEKAGVTDRATFVEGDIFASVPRGGDLYLLKSVLHGLDDERAIDILKHCRRAMNPQGKVFLVEFVMPPGNASFPGKLMDLLMLAGSHGRERTQQEFSSLLEASSFQMAGIVTTRHGYSIIQAFAG